MGDAHATAITYRAPVENHLSIGLNVTCQVVLPADEVRRRFKNELLEPVLDFAEIWFQSIEWITFHDPLAAVTIFNSEVCRFEKGDVDVELASDKLAGYTYWHKNETGKHQVALEVRPESFFKQYFNVF